MIPLLLAATAWLSPTAESYQQGYAKFYDPTLMEQVAVNRGIISDTAHYEAWKTITGYDGLASSILCGDRGREVSVIWPDRSVTFHLIGDCAQREHFERRLALRDVIEVGNQVAMQKGMDGPVPVIVIWDRRMDLSRIR